MCLISKNGYPSIAEEDIICYKHLHYMTDSSQYRSPYQHTIYEIPSTVTDNANEMIVKVQYFDGTFAYEISSGYIHCYKNLLGVKNNVDWIIKYVKIPRCENVIVECVIPKGTKYWEGIWEICAKTIKLVRIVKDDL
jgi:hypothetical protein